MSSENQIWNSLGFPNLLKHSGFKISWTFPSFLHSKNDLVESTKFWFVQPQNLLIIRTTKCLVDPTKYLVDSTKLLGCSSPLRHGKYTFHLFFFSFSCITLLFLYTELRKNCDYLILIFLASLGPKIFIYAKKSSFCLVEKFILQRDKQIGKFGRFNQIIYFNQPKFWIFDETVLLVQEKFFSTCRSTCQP